MKKSVKFYEDLSLSQKELATYMKKESLDNIINIIKKRTELYAAREDLKDDRSKLAKDIGDLFNKGQVNFGCKQKAACDFLSIVIGEKIIYKDSCTIIPFISVVPTKNPNSHNYPLNTPLILKSYQQGGHIRIDGNIGNNLPESRLCYRISTQKEIEEFFNKVSEHQFKSNI